MVGSTGVSGLWFGAGVPRGAIRCARRRAYKRARPPKDSRRWVRGSARACRFGLLEGDGS
jgi:hypothetical protein